ncbi:hypothetical protein GGR20_002650 [Devosia subaequoris]|uniref:Uncharacterized protein n=1 Tax=Devosia subaequoris TaxID=395930 RepID=A0A7W6NCQ2_9HYPH|nr:hypothetical protein [Devosia subaequoris]MBB4052994.1 hypothetical protein [Devosia subaequoris]MCP1210413.1 hypothetical protein [Devosia subaequoris]
MKTMIGTPLVRLIAGFVIWAVGFVVLYAVQALGCAYGWGDWHRPVLIGLYLLALIPLIWLAMPARAGAEDGPLHMAALWANRAALVAAILVFLPTTFASLCI